MKLVCIEMNYPIEPFEVDHADINFIREETVNDGIKVAVIHLKDGRKCVAIDNSLTQ